MPFKTGFINLSDTNHIPREIHRMLSLLGTCNIPVTFMSEDPSETIEHLKDLGLASYFDRICLKVENQAGMILDKLNDVSKPPRLCDVFYVSDRTPAVELVKKVGIAAFHVNAASALAVTSHLRVNM